MDAQETVYDLLPAKAGQRDLLPAAAGQMAEQELVQELRAGSQPAYNYLIAVYHQPLYRLLYHLLQDPAEAADAVQDAFLKVFRSAAQFEGRCSIKTWLYRIAVHEAANHRRWWRRHKQRETSLDAPFGDGNSWSERLTSPQESPLTQAMRAETRQRLESILAQLPEPFRTTVVLRDLEDLGYEEIAEVTGAHLGTVKSRLVRGREMVRKQLLEGEPLRPTSARREAI